jgi:peptidoglycan/LPS O-acetylase OafA/YrhL
LPRPVSASTSYVPALDGIRALAVVAVLGYHFGVSHMGGGLLGVGMFFTLSGFLITEILLNAHDRADGGDGGDGLNLGTFWLRRARRLLPALFLVLVVVLVATAVANPHAFGERVHEAIASGLYVSNWDTILHGVSYFDRIAGPGPFDHLWSLAIEEQFYLVWPLALLGLLKLSKGNLTRIAQLALVLSAVSFTLLAVLAQPGFDNTRAYEGTDTRAGALLVGAALALVYRPRVREEHLRLRGRITVDVAGGLALAVIVWMVASTTEYSMWIYRGGLLVLTLATVVLVAVAVHPTSLVGRALGTAPLRWVGERSYGIYLWHMPVAVFAAQDVFGAYSVRRTVLQIALTVGLAAASWRLIEDPIRRYGLVAAYRYCRYRLWKPRSFVQGREVGLLAGAGAVVLAASAVLAVTGLITAPPRLSAAGVETSADTGGSALISSSIQPSPRHSSHTTGGSHHVGSHHDGPIGGPHPRGGHRGPTGGGPPTHGRAQTSCDSVVHVGDSTSLGLVEPSYLPNRGDRIIAQYHDVGVGNVTTDVLGARSIVETFEGQPNADTATQQRISAGYDGCWVFAMGTNDTANQYVGGVVPLDERIDRLMDDVHGQPVMWLTLKTELSSGPWQDAQMQKWNDALLAACSRYPNLRIYDWRSQVKDSWFISDGIHFTSDGYRQRGKRIANALATAFPQDGPPSSSCMVVPGG